MKNHPLRLNNYTSTDDLQKIMGLILAAASTLALILTLQELVNGMAAISRGSGSQCRQNQLAEIVHVGLDLFQILLILAF